MTTTPTVVNDQTLTLSGTTPFTGQISVERGGVLDVAQPLGIGSVITDDGGIINIVTAHPEDDGTIFLNKGLLNLGGPMFIGLGEHIAVNVITSHPEDDIFFNRGLLPFDGSMFSFGEHMAITNDLAEISIAGLPITPETIPTVTWTQNPTTNSGMFQLIFAGQVESELNLTTTQSTAAALRFDFVGNTGTLVFRPGLVDEPFIAAQS
jgi:hypothetical protein